MNDRVPITYFDLNADKIESIAKTGKELGLELFVLDDGWFGKRNDDSTSLGDWYVDRNKLPNCLPDLVERVTRLGMKFGLWFEPEMISPGSDLYRSGIRKGTALPRTGCAALFLKLPDS